ncbi:MAG TPA: hypothetical protein VHL11_22945, partial [Phototrophicaceae bacterium]|nr:hypothetical protein [Phototrophicaceae bacterium]
TPAAFAEVYRYSKDNLGAILQLNDQAVAANGFTADFPKDSITLFVIQTGGAATELLVNNSFEDAGGSNAEALNWTPKNTVKDKRKCNKDGKPPISKTGDCTFQFTGTGGINSSITQQVDPSAILSGDTLVLSAWIYGKNISGGGKIQAKLKYGDTGKTKIKFAVLPGSYTYGQFVNAEQTIGTPTTAKVTVIMNSGSGKFYVDDISLALTAAGARAASHALPNSVPLPANPSNISQNKDISSSKG